VRSTVLVLAAQAWALLLTLPPDLVPSTHHLAGTLDGRRPSFDVLTWYLQPGGPASGWMLMVAAMMSPMLIAPVRYVRDRSLARRRPRAVALFVAGYGTTWAAAGAVLLATVLGAQQLAAPAPLGAASALLVAVIWESSPAKQRCLNRSHAHPALRAFGAAADLDALRFGITHAAWCVGSCWAVMLLPPSAPSGHLAVMAAVTAWLVAERIEGPAPARWTLRRPAKAARLLVAQTRWWLRRERSGRALPATLNV
jgi:predicted metal-binding membrane protein